MTELTKQEMWERMPLLRWEHWEYKLNEEGDAYEWVDTRDFCADERCKHERGVHALTPTNADCWVKDCPCEDYVQG